MGKELTSGFAVALRIAMPRSCMSRSVSLTSLEDMVSVDVRWSFCLGVKQWW